MVLWEITVGTAYFLGLKRTYRLALRLQRRIVGDNHPRLRHHLQSRTRGVFDVALTVHKSIQQRDIEVGRSLGNWILRWLDKMKPSANIRGESAGCLSIGDGKGKQTLKPCQSIRTSPGSGNSKTLEQESDGRHLFSLGSGVRPKYSPTLGMMMRPSKPTGMNSHYRHLYSIPITPNSNFSGKGRYESVYRKDLLQWMQN